MENCSRYFANKQCEYFPCHEGLDEFNCLFCYCPLYLREHCPGNPKYIESKGRIIKSCNDCTFPHKPENYDTIIKFLIKG
jgi:Zn-finger protein